MVFAAGPVILREAKVAAEPPPALSETVYGPADTQVTATVVCASILAASVVWVLKFSGLAATVQLLLSVRVTVMLAVAVPAIAIGALASSATARSDDLSRFIP